PSSGRQRARVAGMALAGAGFVLLLHGLGPGFGLGTPRRILLLLLALVGVALSAVASRRASYVTVRRRLRPEAVLVVVLLAAAVAGAAALGAARSSALQERPRDATLTLATFNVRSGFGADGRFDPRRQGTLLADEDVDLVLVNEVDRGWWLTGGQDLLPGLAAALGLEHVAFVPAADEVTGHALLSRYPISEVSSAALPGGDRHAPRSQLAAIVEVSEDLDLGIVGAQLLPGGADEEVRLAQARALAGTIARLRERALPTVVLGDLGVREGTTILDTLEPLVTSALPENSTTYPSWQPVDQRDHVLLSPELRRATVRTPTTLTSSHLPVIVTVEVRRPVL
ncbi:MAG: endonuclease/exonuclease/phosphatase family protein, partial [Nitriliruptoraceae bacterium]